MKFGSVKEYFYKLNSRGYQLMMVPFILFIFFYAQSILNLNSFVVLSQENSYLLFKSLSSISMIVLTIVQLAANRKARMIGSEVGLGIKLEKLGTLLTRKMMIMALTVMMMPLALLFTGDNYFSLAFGVLVLWFFLQWPTPDRVCRLLNLRGDEREMVITRGEAFK